MTPAMFRDPVLRTAIHESSHAVMGAVHGLTVNYSEVLSTPATSFNGKPLQQHAAGVTVYNRRPDPLAELHKPLVAAAGAAGETVWDFGGKPTLTEVLRALQAHVHDHDQVTELSHRRGENPSEVVARLLPLVDRLWSPIAQLAFQMKAQHRIEHRDVLAALGIPSAQDAPRYTRAIRAGAAPGTLTVGRMSF